MEIVVHTRLLKSTICRQPVISWFIPSMTLMHAIGYMVINALKLLTIPLASEMYGHSLGVFEMVIYHKIDHIIVIAAGT